MIPDQITVFRTVGSGGAAMPVQPSSEQKTVRPFRRGQVSRSVALYFKGIRPVLEQFEVYQNLQWKIEKSNFYLYYN